MTPLIWIALLGGGLYLFTRKGAPAAAGEQGTTPGTTPGTGELLTTDGIKKKFLSDMTVFKAAFEAANKTPFTNEAEALKNLEGADDRARAVAMAEFAKTAAEVKGTDDVLSNAAMNLALDYRNMFTMSNRAAKADKLIEETLTFVKNKLAPEKAQPLDKAFSDLVVDSPMMAIIAEPVASVALNPQSLAVGAPKTNADRDYAALFYQAEPLKEGQTKPDTTQVGTGTVSANADYQLDSYSLSNPDGTKILAYLGKVKEGSDPKYGNYILTFAPAPKAG